MIYRITNHYKHIFIRWKSKAKVLLSQDFRTNFVMKNHFFCKIIQTVDSKLINFFIFPIHILDTLLITSIPKFSVQSFSIVLYISHVFTYIPMLWKEVFECFVVCIYVVIYFSKCHYIFSTY